MYGAMSAVACDADVVGGDIGAQGEGGRFADTVEIHPAYPAIDNLLEGEWLVGCLLYTSPSPRDRG